MPPPQNPPLISGYSSLLGQYKGLSLADEGVDYEMRIPWSSFSVSLMMVLRPSHKLQPTVAMIGLYSAPGGKEKDTIIAPALLTGLTDRDRYQDLRVTEERVLTSQSVFARVTVKHMGQATVDVFVLGRYLP